MLRLDRIIAVLLVMLLSVVITACNPKQNNNQPSQPPNSVQTARPAQVDNSVNKLNQNGKMPKEALYVCQTTRNQVAVIDLATDEIVKEIPVGAKPMALIKSPDNRYIYVANSGSGDVYIINTLSGEIDAKISMGNQPVAMAVNKAGDKLYALDYYLNRVSVLDLMLRSMIGVYELNTYGFDERIEPPDCCSDIFGEPMGAGRKPSAIVLDEAENRIYVGNMGTWDVAVIDVAKEKEEKVYDAIFGINDMFLAGPGKKLFISAAGNEIEINDSILILDTKGGEIIDKLKVGVKPVSMALSPDGLIIYVITQKDTMLTGLKVVTGEIINQCLLKGEPGDIAISEDGNKAFVANVLDGTVLIMDTNTYSVLKTIEAGVTPKALVYIKTNKELPGS